MAKLIKTEMLVQRVTFSPDARDDIGSVGVNYAEQYLVERKHYKSWYGRVKFKDTVIDQEIVPYEALLEHHAFGECRWKSKFAQYI